MKKTGIQVYSRMVVGWLAVFLLVTVNTTYAATHKIQFGGSFGLAYSPNSLNVSVGDTIEWEGDFTSHPLSSTSVPSGAQSFHQSTGTTFIYFVAAEGTYLYQCDFHFSAGMTGSFVAAGTTDVNISQAAINPHIFKLNQNYPNPFNPTTNISFNIPYQTFVSLRVYNAIGNEVATIVNENMTKGSYSRTWNAASLASGAYFYRLQAGRFTETRKLILLK